MRLIDADALARHLSDWAFAEAPNERDSDTIKKFREIAYRTIGACMKAVENAPTISQWIPVSERLPDGKDDSYLVTRTDGKYTWVEEGDFVIDEFFFLGDEYRFDTRKIEDIAWMPLPEPMR